MAIISSDLLLGCSGSVFEAQLLAEGGTTPYSWSITSGVLPGGLVLTTEEDWSGYISGIITAPVGYYSCEITVTDNSLATAVQTLNFVVKNHLELDTTLPPDASVAVPYSFTFSLLTSSAGPVYEVFAGTLPPGLILNSSTGELSGTPTDSGSYTFTIKVTN